MWLEFWDEWVPMVTRGEDYAVILNGDAIEGAHHNASTPITNNLKDQRAIAFEILSPIVNNPRCREYYHIRGTETHVGISGEHEEALAEQLRAIPNEFGNHARWEMWYRLHGCLIHFTHHVGSTSSAAYESTAVFKELVEAYNESGRWNNEPPVAVVRSHRHRGMHIVIPTDSGYGMSIVTPGWQLKTPHVYRMGLGRSSTPQIGGYLLRHGDEDHLYPRFRIWKIQRPAEVGNGRDEDNV